MSLTAKPGLDSPRLLRYERQVKIVAVYAVPQSDEPPGRGVWAERRDVLVENCIEVTRASLATAIAEEAH